MFMVYFILCGFYMLSRKAAAEETVPNLFNKFQQNDYKLKYERTDVVSYNKSIIKQFKMVTFKHNRTSAVTNLTLEFKIDSGNEVEMVAQGYKFMSNEYRYFPIRMQLNLCVAISENLAGVGKFADNGNCIKCPFEKDKIMHVNNWSPDESKFPPLIPSGRYMLEMQLLYRSSELALVRSYSEIYRPFVN